ncbi:MAG: hypothetical protein KIT82_18695, partial [Bradyrhizobium sp.]|nr:hypothetical protein [Bradyrhizobium sp.]
MSDPAPSIRVDQVFHGYDRGHKELASSLRLDDEARAIMLIHSDLLADLGDGADRAYLTCYSLPSASRHVLARTWSAGLGFRPGSVWTHSLLLDYQALALIVDLVALEPLLMRSGEIERGKLAKPLVVSPFAASAPIRIGSNAAAAIKGLYGGVDGVAEVPSRGRADDDRLALALWRQMWPGMRRHFTFATGVGAGRPMKGADWMMRFVAEPTGHAAPDLSPGLRVLLEDLPSSGQTPL